MKIEITNQKPQIAVAIKKTKINMSNIANDIDEMSQKLISFLEEHNTQMFGAPYLAYMNANEDFSQFDIELGFPVEKPLPVSGEIYMSQTYEGKAVVSLYKGPYEELESSYMALMNYIKENSLESTGVYYEYYLNDPAETPESELLTEIIFPIK